MAEKKNPLLDLLFKEVEKELKNVARDVINIIVPGKGDELIPRPKPVIRVEDLVYTPSQKEKAAKLPAALPVKTGDNTLGFKIIVRTPLFGDYSNSKIKITNIKNHKVIIAEPVYTLDLLDNIPSRYAFLSSEAMIALDISDNTFVLLSWTKQDSTLGPQ